MELKDKLLAYAMVQTFEAPDFEYDCRQVLNLSWSNPTSEEFAAALAELRQKVVSIWPELPEFIEQLEV